jgi:hypothetical protein
LFYACRWDRTELAKELLRRGSKLTDDVLCGPVKHANVELLKILIAKKANLNCVFRKNVEGSQMWPDGETLLGYAIHMISHVEFELGTRNAVLDYPATIAELLIKAGANVNQPSNWWRVTRVRSEYVGHIQPTPPIRIAGSRGLEGMMKLLWKSGAKGTLQEAMADCSLERAAYRNSPAIVKLLIKAGADVNAAGEETGKRPIEIAREKGHTAVLEILKRAGAKE